MKKTAFILIAVAGWAFTAAKAPAQRDNGYGQSTVTCSSDDGSRHYCNADTSGRVQMTRQRSGSRCTQGYSYGYDQRGIWVDHGCRADFAVYSRGNNGNWNNGNGGNWNNGGRDRDRDNGNWQGNGGPGAVDSVTCSSDDGRRQYCPADTSGRINMVKQRSDAKCTKGYSWGYDQRGIWVDHGCRADFSVESRGNGWRR